MEAIPIQAATMVKKKKIIKDGLIGHHWKERPIGHVNFVCPSTGERQGQKVGMGGLGSGGRVWGTFGIALEM